MLLQREKIFCQRKIVYLPIEKIKPSRFQPRREFDDYELSGLAESIRQNGLLQPISVRDQADGLYELIAGERRFRACSMVGMKSIAAIIFEIDDRKAAIFSLLENLQRKNLSIFEEAEGILKLLEQQDITRHEAANYLGIAQSTLSNKMKILCLTIEQRERIVMAKLTERHARALARVPVELRDEILDVIIAKQLTVNESDEYIESLINPATEETKSIKKCFSSIGDIRLFSNSLNRIVDTMKKSGIDAKTGKSETEEFIKYTITIPKPVLKKVSNSAEGLQLQFKMTSR
ncbi:MAG: ParB/RepB/Spo0J family partition protein [Oscillospiraceae bacterium]